MALDPSILAQTANPPSPLEMLARVQALRNAQQQQQLGQQQIQAETLKNQQTQLDLDDQQKFRQAWLDADGDPDKAARLALSKGVGPKTMMAVQQQVLATAKERAALQGTQLDNLNKKNDALNALLAPVEAEKDPAKQAALWGQQMQAGVQNGVIAPQEAQQHPYPGPDGVHQYRAGLNTEKWINAQAAQIKSQVDQDRFNTEKPGLQTKATGDQLDLLGRQIGGVKDQAGYQALIRQLPPQVVAQLPPTFDPATTPALIKRMAVPAQQQPTYDIDTAKANAIKALAADPQAAIAQIDQIIPPQMAGNADVNRAYKTLVQGALARGDMESAKGAIEHAAEYSAHIAGETNPQVIGARVGQAVATAKATAPIEIQKDLDKQVALAKQSPDAFAGITNGQARNQAETETDKIGKDYADVINRVQTLKDTLAAVRSGNQAAPAMAQIELLRSQLNRINRTELESVSNGAGSLVQQMEGRLGKIASGQPIPPEVLKGMDQLADLQEQAAERGYSTGMIRLKNRGVDTSKLAKPTIAPTNQQSPTIKLRAPDGSVKDVPADQAEHYISLGAKRL